MAQLAPAVYFGELRMHARALAAASLGLAAGYQLTSYLANLFGPYLLHAFGWSKAQLSLGGTAALCTVVLGPVAGRIVDSVGVRPMATAGVIATPLVYVSYACMNGDIRIFLAIAVLQTVMMGLATSSIVYARLVAQEFHRARGAALAIAACSPAVTSMLVARPLTALIEAHGWRAGYLALAVGTGAAGAVVLLMLPRRQRTVTASLKASPLKASPRGSALFRRIVRNPAFAIIMIGMLLCNLPIMMQASQLGVLLQDRGVAATSISWMVALYAMAVLIGRVLCGLSLDRWPTHRVVAIALSLPGLGLLILASGVTHQGALVGALSLLGLSIGAEVDITSYVVMRYFDMEIFSTVVGLVGSAMALAAASGALMLSLTLRASGSFTLFLIIAGLASFTGGASFLLLGRVGRQQAAVPAASECDAAA